jgi:outer membrane protein TolC
MRTTMRCVALVCGLLVASGPTAVRAQEVRVPAADALRARTYAVAPLEQGTLSLADAVRMTVLFNPSVTKATQSVEAAAGLHREYRGLFDSSLSVTPHVIYIQQPLTPYMIGRQRDTRTLLKSIYDGYSEIAVELRQMADDLKPRAPYCPAIGGSLLTSYNLVSRDVDTLNSNTGVYKDTLDDQEWAQIGATTDFSVPAIPDFSTLASQADFCSRGAGADPLMEALSYYNMMNRLAKVDFWGSKTAGTVIESLIQMPRETAMYRAQIAEAVAARARLAWERLGNVPVDELQRQFTFDAALDRQFRNGIAFQATAEMLSGEQNFRDKPFDPSFGGMGIPARFKPEIAVGFNVPLGKGRGTTATAAQERSALFALNARREQLQHATAEEVLRTVLAYFDVIATQQTLDLALQSAGIVEKVQQLTEQQVNAGDLAAAELDRVKARAAAVNAIVSDARKALTEARIGLATNIGADGTGGIDQLRAADTFSAAIKPVPPVDTLVTQALVRRRDVRSTSELVKASDALHAGARADLKRKFDLGVRGGMSNLYESPNFKYLPDEEQDVPLYSCNQNRNNLTPECVMKPGHSTITPVRFFSWRGWDRAITKRWEPFIEAKVTIELPFGNNAARGRAKQADADARARRIQATDLERNISQTLVSVSSSLKSAADRVEQLSIAVARDSEVVDLAVQQFSARELTLIEALLTEEQTTQDRLALVRQRQAYLSLLARLKYETGDLLALAGPAGSEMLTFEPSDFVSK